MRQGSKRASVAARLYVTFFELISWSCYDIVFLFVNEILLDTSSGDIGYKKTRGPLSAKDNSPLAES